MSAKKTDMLTAAIPISKEKDNTPRVRIFIPPREDHPDLKVDQYEHVTIDGKTTLVKRGEHVEVTVPVYLQLRNRFPHL